MYMYTYTAAVCINTHVQLLYKYASIAVVCICTPAVIKLLETYHSDGETTLNRLRISTSHDIHDNLLYQQP